MRGRTILPDSWVGYVAQDEVLCRFHLRFKSTEFEGNFCNSAIRTHIPHLFAAPGIWTPTPLQPRIRTLMSLVSRLFTEQSQAMVTRRSPVGHQLNHFHPWIPPSSWPWSLLQRLPALDSAGPVPHPRKVPGANPSDIFQHISERKYISIYVYIIITNYVRIYIIIHISKIKTLSSLAV